MTEALNEYVQADQRYRQAQDRYFEVSVVQPGREIETGEPLTVEALEMLARLRQEADEAHQRWRDSLQGST